MPFKMLISEFRTGIILNMETRKRHLGGSELPYRYFDSIAELLTFATTLVQNNSTLEVTVWDGDGNYVQTVAT